MHLKAIGGWTLAREISQGFSRFEEWGETPHSISSDAMSSEPKSKGNLLIQMLPQNILQCTVIVAWLRVSWSDSSGRCLHGSSVKCQFVMQLDSISELGQRLYWPLHALGHAWSLMNRLASIQNLNITHFQTPVNPFVKEIHRNNFHKY